MEQERIKLREQIKKIEAMSDQDLLARLPSLRADALIGLTPLLIERWFKAKNETLKSELFKFFLDTKRQEELPYFLEAINKDEYAEVKNEILSIFWQSSLDLTEYLDELVEIALEGDYMTLIEVATIIETFEEEFDEEQVMNVIYLIEETIDSESDDERVKLLTNLRQVVSELSLI